MQTILRISILLFFVFPFYFFPQPVDHKYFEENIEVYFGFELNTRIDLNILTNVISIDNIEGDNVFAYANEDEYRHFLELNISHEILKKPGKFIQPEMSDQISTIMEWDTYPTYEAYVAMMNQFATEYPDICELIDAGNSVQGRKILFVKISDNVAVREPEPQFLYTSTMHGDEATGYILMLRLIDSLLTSYSSDTRITNLVNNVEIWINPLANPDGTYHGGNGTVYGATRYNANGYDLNRNFPDPVNGIHPNEQLETGVFRNIAENNNFVLSANFHGGTEVVNYPWDTWTNGFPDYISHPDEAWYAFISHLYADTAQANSPPTYMDGFDDGTTNGGAWYVIHGGRQDYMNYFKNSREVTIEISNTKLLPGSQLPAHWNYNKKSFLDYIENTLFGVRGIVTDTSGNPLYATVTVLEHDAMNSEILTDSINGNYHRMLSPGIYSLSFSSTGYFSKLIDNVTVENFISTVLNVELIPENPIPVELISFSGNVQGNDIFLQWSTATELNNSGFEIQKKKLVENTNWQNIGFIEGAGSSTNINTYSFVDYNVIEGIYNYRLKQKDYNGSFTISDAIEVNNISPVKFSLQQNYPNPFNPSTLISYSIPDNAFVLLKVFDILGNEIKTLVSEFQTAGTYNVIFDATNLSTGVYIYKLQSSQLLLMRKMVIIK